MILPIINMDITPLVQFLVVVSYFGLIFGLSVEIIGGNPFQMMKKTVEADNHDMTSETPEENSSSD